MSKKVSMVNMKTEYDFSEDLHSEFGNNPQHVYLKFKNGNVIKLSWMAIKDLAKLYNEHK